MRRLVLASRNKGKLEELKELLADLPVEIVSVGEFPDVPEVDETGTSFAENAVLKAQTVARVTGELVLADDSGLVVDGLNGAPGVYSARYGQPGWTDRQRYEYLLQELQGVPEAKRTARFCCVTAVYDPIAGHLELTEGTVEGRITEKPAGENGFGYDPVFFVPEAGKNMAELTETEKNQISHRARAIRKMKPLLKSFLE